MVVLGFEELARAVGPGSERAGVATDPRGVASDAPLASRAVVRVPWDAEALRLDGTIKRSVALGSCSAED